MGKPMHLSYFESNQRPSAQMSSRRAQIMALLKWTLCSLLLLHAATCSKYLGESTDDVFICIVMKERQEHLLQIVYLYFLDQRCIAPVPLYGSEIF